jgi:hypothetical protein
MATEMFTNLAYIPGFLDQYDSELSSIENAANRMEARIERERATLVRSDGSPKFAPQEYAEREQAILEAATAEYDQAVSRYVARSEQEVADLQKKLAKLEGSDGWERLSESQQQTAASRREFVKEDVQTLPAPELVKRAQASIAAGNLAECWLLKRYISQRANPLDANGMPAVRTTSDRDRELVAVLRELGALFGDEDRATREREIDEKLRAAQALPLAIDTARRKADGSDARGLAQFRQHVMARF